MLLRKKPILCNYYVTYRCNAKCGFCDIWEKPSPYVAPDQVEQNLKSLKKLGVKVIDFTGGEPLLHKQLPEFLRLAKKLGFITTVTTNALLYPKMAKNLKGNIDMLHFSLDSAEKAKHDQLRGVACFDFVMESIKVARSLGEIPDIIFTVFKHNIGEIEKVYSQISKPNKLMLILNPFFEYNSVDIGDGFSKADLSILKSWARKPLVFMNKALLSLRLDGGNDVLNPVCTAGHSCIVISPENKLVTPCYHLGTESFKLSGNLDEIYHSEKVKSEREKAGKLDACKGCSINCYMQPSFATKLNKYWFQSLPSTLKYNWTKGTWKKL